MKIGIIADTHDNLGKIKKAVKILNKHDLDFLIHCGDYIAPFSLKPLQKLNCQWCGVFGNNDGEKEGLRKESGGRIHQAPYFLNFCSRRIAVVHEFEDYDADIILFGHTHKPIVDKKDKLLINPGEVSGWLYGRSTLVILELDNLDAKLVTF